MSACFVSALTKAVTITLYMVLLQIHGLQSSLPSPTNEDLSATINKLFDHIYSYQAEKDSKTFLPFTWSHKKGIYESDVKLYFHGNRVMTITRDLFAVYDVNMFATSWINIAMLEAYSFNKVTKPSAQKLQMSLDAIAEFVNKNANYSNSVMCFWTQEYKEILQTWQSAPKNLLHLIKFSDKIPWNILEDLLHFLGFSGLEEDIKSLISRKDTMLKAFHIPPDFDDTFVNLGLGSLLADSKSDFPEQYKSWLAHNTNITSVFDALKKYAYRPFSSDKAVNSIDPRTYFYLRGFLENATSTGRDVALVSTWVQNINESLEMLSKGVAMPFNVNNVDCAVSANTIYGITSGILSGILPLGTLDDPEIQKIYLNTSSMLEWQLHTRLSERSDLALAYYPSILEFYWFVARTVTAVERVHLQGNTPHPAIEKAYQLLSQAQRTSTTEHILSLATRDEDELFFDDFMGDADTTKKAEDRLFTTSMAVNALQGIWSVFDETLGQNIWVKDTPDDVIETVTSAVTFLQKNIFSGLYKPWNAIFSGSVKGMSTLPFLYPFNRFEDSKSMINKVRAMQGTISEEEYLAMAKAPIPRFQNMTTPMEFHGFNKDGGVFPFWSSEPYTYATTLLALSHFQNTYQENV